MEIFNDCPQASASGTYHFEEDGDLNGVMKVAFRNNYEFIYRNSIKRIIWGGMFLTSNWIGNKPYGKCTIEFLEVKFDLHFDDTNGQYLRPANNITFLTKDLKTIKELTLDIRRYQNTSIILIGQIITPSTIAPANIPNPNLSTNESALKATKPPSPITIVSHFKAPPVPKLQTAKKNVAGRKLSFLPESQNKRVKGGGEDEEKNVLMLRPMRRCRFCEEMSMGSFCGHCEKLYRSGFLSVINTRCDRCQLITPFNLNDYNLDLGLICQMCKDSEKSIGGFRVLDCDHNSVIIESCTLMRLFLSTQKVVEIFGKPKESSDIMTRIGKLKKYTYVIHDESKSFKPFVLISFPEILPPYHNPNTPSIYYCKCSTDDAIKLKLLLSHSFISTPYQLLNPLSIDLQPLLS